MADYAEAVGEAWIDIKLRGDLEQQVAARVDNANQGAETSDGLTTIAVTTTTQSGTSSQPKSSAPAKKKPPTVTNPGNPES